MGKLNSAIHHLVWTFGVVSGLFLIAAYWPEISEGIVRGYREAMAEADGDATDRDEVTVQRPGHWYACFDCGEFVPESDLENVEVPSSVDHVPDESAGCYILVCSECRAASADADAAGE